MKDLDLVALSKVESTSCFVIGKDGIDYPEYERVLVKIDMGNGKRKYINIVRQNRYYEAGIDHSIESYILEGEGIYINTVGERFKLYDTDKFEARLKKLEKELSKVDYKIV